MWIPKYDKISKYRFSSCNVNHSNSLYVIHCIYVIIRCLSKVPTLYLSSPLFSYYCSEKHNNVHDKLYLWLPIPRIHSFEKPYTLIRFQFLVPQLINACLLTDFLFGQDAYSLFSMCKIIILEFLYIGHQCSTNFELIII